MSAYAEASKAAFRVFDDTSPLVEGLSIDEAFLDVRGLGGSRARLQRSLRGCDGRCAIASGCRSRWASRGPKFLAKVASGVAKPDGLLVVPPDGELSFLHPLPVERSGASAGDCEEASRAEHPRRSARLPAYPRLYW